MRVNQTVTLANGRVVPALGLGTWHMGENKANRAAEVAALRAGIELGLSVIDTAEMYADGRAEEVVADALAGQRERVYLVSKVLPGNASRMGTVASCEASLRRLKTDHIDLYLLHWRGGHPLSETITAFETLKASGKIGGWGVSNFDTEGMEDLQKAVHGTNCIANQVLYHAASRGIEYDLLSYCNAKSIVTMAYCPLGQGLLVSHRVFSSLAQKHDVPATAVAIAWLIRQPGVLAIPKSAAAERVRGFAKANSVRLDSADLQLIDKAFPPPRRKTTLDMA